MPTAELTVDTPMEEMEIHGVLVKARAVQAERGHAKRILWTHDGHVCMQGAIILASFTDPDRRYQEAYRASAEAVEHAAAKAMGFRGVGDMCAWNNQSHIGLDDVLARFDAAIEATAPMAA